MNRRDAVLQAMDVQATLFQIDDRPLEGDHFRDTQSVAIGQQDQRRVPVTVSPHTLRSSDEPTDFLFRKILTRTNVYVLRLAGRRLSRKRCLAFTAGSAHYSQNSTSMLPNFPENGLFRESRIVLVNRPVAA
jgi:hypothetical protein